MFLQLKTRLKKMIKKDIRLSINTETLLKVKKIRSYYGLGADTKAIRKAIELIAKQIESFEADKLHYENTSKRLSHEFTNKIQLTISELLEQENKINKGL